MPPHDTTDGSPASRHTDRGAELDLVLSALADPHRRAVVDILRGGPRSASDMATTLSLSRPMMSRHLKILRRAGLISSELLDTDARVRMIQLRQDRLTDLRWWLDEVTEFWTVQLDSFAHHVRTANPTTTHDPGEDRPPTHTSCADEVRPTPSNSVDRA